MLGTSAMGWLATPTAPGYSKMRITSFPDGSVIAYGGASFPAGFRPTLGRTPHRRRSKVDSVLANVKRAATLRGGVAAVAQTLFANIFILGINFGTGVITARLLGPHGR